MGIVKYTYAHNNTQSVFANVSLLALLQKETLISSIHCRFLWFKDSHNDELKMTNMLPLNIKLKRDVSWDTSKQ